MLRVLLPLAGSCYPFQHTIITFKRRTRLLESAISLHPQSIDMANHHRYRIRPRESEVEMYRGQKVRFPFSVINQPSFKAPPLIQLFSSCHSYMVRLWIQ